MQQRNRSEQDNYERNRRARQELERNERITVFGNTATRTYYTKRCDPDTAELLMMTLAEAKKAQFRSAKCPPGR